MVFPVICALVKNATGYKKDEKQKEVSILHSELFLKYEDDVIVVLESSLNS